MSLAPRSSLRSLVLLMSHGKPWLSSSFSSSSYSGVLGTATPVAPAVQSPAVPALPDCSSPKSPEHQELVLHPLPGGPCGADDKPSLYAGSEDPKYPIPDDGSCSTLEPASGYVLPDPGPNSLLNPIHDTNPPPPTRPHLPGKKGTEGVIGKNQEHPVPSLCTVDQDPKHPIPDGGSYSSTPAPVRRPDKPPPTKTSNDENVPHGLHCRSSPI